MSFSVNKNNTDQFVTYNVEKHKKAASNHYNHHSSTTSYYGATRNDKAKALAKQLELKYNNDFLGLGQDLGIDYRKWALFCDYADYNHDKNFWDWEDIAYQLVGMDEGEESTKSIDGHIKKGTIINCVNRAAQKTIDLPDGITLSEDHLDLDMDQYSNRSDHIESWHKTLMSADERNNIDVYVLSKRIETVGVDVVLNKIAENYDIPEDVISRFKYNYALKHTKEGIFNANCLAWFLKGISSTSYEENPYDRSNQISKDVLISSIHAGAGVAPNTEVEETSIDEEVPEVIPAEEIAEEAAPEYTVAESTYTNGASSYTVPEGRGLTFIADDLVKKDEAKMRGLLGMPSGSKEELRAALKDKMKAHIDLQANLEQRVGAVSGEGIYYFYKEATLDLATVFTA